MMKAGVLLNKLNQTLGLETFMTGKIEQNQGQTKTWGNGPDCKGLMDGADFTKLTSFECLSHRLVGRLFMQRICTGTNTWKLDMISDNVIQQPLATFHLFRIHQYQTDEWLTIHLR